MGVCGDLDCFWIIGWINFAISQPCIELQIAVHVFVCVYMCVCRLSYKPGIFGRNGQWPTQLMQSGCIIIVSVGIIVFLCTVLLRIWLMSLSSYVPYILDYIPHWCIFNNLSIWCTCGISGANFFCWHIYRTSMLKF